MITIKKKKLLDLFIISNYAFLTIDILYAHSVNSFEHGAEYMPLVFSAFAALALTIGPFMPKRTKEYLSTALAAASVVVGATGMYFHLESQFFKSQSLASLTYTAPLVAPLTYTALGLLLFLNCFVSSSQGRAWAAWVYIIAYFGFVGNFVLSLFDHYQNGFYYGTEWIPVLSAAFLVGFGPFYLTRDCTTPVRRIIHALLALQVAVGLLGFVLHLYGIITHGTSPNLVDRVLYGPPLLAPLLFANIAVLMTIGIRAFHEEGKALSLRPSPRIR